MGGALTSECKNCGAKISENFCGRCGQRHLPKGLNVPEIASELLDSVVRLDSRLWRTFVGLTRNPGQLAADYVSGKRAQFVNPVRYCIAGIALSAAATITTGEFERLSLSMLPEGSNASAEMIRPFTNVFAKYLNLLAILSVPIYTLFLRLLFLRAGRNMAEIFSFSCFVVGQVSLLGVLGTVLNTYVYYLGLWPSVTINSVLTLYAVHVFFRKRFLYSMFAANIAYLAYIAVISALFWLLFDFQGTGTA